MLRYVCWHILLMRKFFTIVALCTLASSALAREEAKVYRWVDANGDVHYSDSIPAEYRDRPKDVLDDTGITIGMIAETPETPVNSGKGKATASRSRASRNLPFRR